MNLIEWTEQYIRFKDAMKKNIKEIRTEKNKLIIKEKNEEKEYLIEEKLDKTIENLKEKKQIIVCLNTKENLNTLINKWDEVKNKKKLTIIFVQLETNDKWLIQPHTHDKISENISEGLKTLYESIKNKD